MTIIYLILILLEHRRWWYCIRAAAVWDGPIKYIQQQQQQQQRDIETITEKEEIKQARIITNGNEKYRWSTD